jgi:hypothetical protein
VDHHVRHCVVVCGWVLLCVLPIFLECPRATQNTFERHADLFVYSDGKPAARAVTSHTNFLATSTACTMWHESVKVSRKRSSSSLCVIQSLLVSIYLFGATREQHGCGHPYEPEKSEKSGKK